MMTPMTTPPLSSSYRPSSRLLSWWVVMASASSLLLLLLPGPSQGCFQGILPLRSSRMWVQATGVQAYLQYEVGGDEMSDIGVIPRGREMSGQKTLKCLGVHSSNQALVQILQRDLSSGTLTSAYQCLRFDSLDQRVVRLSRTEMKSSKKEVHCDTDPYVPDSSVLVDSSADAPTMPCPLHGSFQASFSNPRESSRISSSSHVTSSSTPGCLAKVHFNCNNQNVMATFGPQCQPPIYKFNRNKIRHHSSTHLQCIGEWHLTEQQGQSSKVIVLSTIDQGSTSNIWCLHYKVVNNSGENFQVFLSFDGRCSLTDPFSDSDSENSVFSKDTMYGYLANFVPARDTRCSDKFYINQCRNRIINCSESNACPSECGRCYSIPKPDACMFMPETIGSWEVVNSTKAFSVKVTKDGFETSTYGKFSCRHSDETKMFYTNPVVQYDTKNNFCMPVYACMQIISVSPGVSTFYLRQTVSVLDIDRLTTSGREKIATCEKNNEMFKDHPVREGEMMTLIDESKLQPIPCNFGARTQFPTTRGFCLFNVEECSGKSCVALNVSYDNQTCHENMPVLPVAPVHRCYASLKFQDGIKGLLTYSDELDKYACWIFTSARLFVAEPKMCNNEAVRRVFTDKHAAVKYDAIEAFTVPVLQVQGSSGKIEPRLFLYVICFIWCMKLFVQL